MNEQGITRLIIENSRSSDKQAFTPDQSFATNNQYNKVIGDVLDAERQRAYDEGYKQAVEQAKKDWDEKINFLQGMLQSLDNVFVDIDELIEEKTVEIAISIAKQIIRRELSIDSGQVVSMAKQAIELMPKDGKKINIYINPNDEKYFQSINLDTKDSDNITLHKDPSIGIGGCKANTDYSMIDLTIDTQIGAIASQVLGDQRADR